MSSRFARLTIRSKVVLAFALVLCCTIGLGLFAVERLDTVNRATAIVGNLHLVRTRLLGQLSYHTMRIRQLEATAVLAPDAAARAQEAATMKKVRAQADQVRRDYEALADEGDERRQADAIAALWQGYLRMHEKFATLEQAGNIAALATLYRGDMRSDFNRFQDGLNALTVLNDSEAKRAVESAAALGQSARIWIFSSLALVALLCLSIGISMIRGVSRPIRAMTDVMQKLADKDLSVAIPAVGRGDEIGGMAGAVQVFKENMIKAATLEAEQIAARATRERRQAALEQYTQDFGT